MEGGHVSDLFDLPIQVIYNLLHVFELKGELSPILSGVGKFLDQIRIFLGSPLYLLIPSFDGKISFLIDFLNLCIDMPNMSFYLIHTASIMIIPFILRHELEILIVNGVHLLLVILTIAAFGLGYRLDLLANAA